MKKIICSLLLIFMLILGVGCGEVRTQSSQQSLIYQSSSDKSIEDSALSDSSQSSSLDVSVDSQNNSQQSSFLSSSSNTSQEQSSSVLVSSGESSLSSSISYEQSSSLTCSSSSEQTSTSQNTSSQQSSSVSLSKTQSSISSASLSSLSSNVSSSLSISSSSQNISTSTSSVSSSTSSSVVKQYSITWIVDGVSTTEKVTEGEIPTYNGTPTKEATAQYTYTFSGWDKEVVEASQDTTYTAQFSQTLNEYTITWVVDGEITTSQVAYGSVPVYNGTPSKEADVQYTYTFNGWDKELVAVTGEATYTAQFSKTVNKYTITWVVDGEITTSQVAYGSVPVYNGTPSKEADVQYTYTFNGWDKELVAVTGEATYTAQFSKTVNKYAITWIVEGVSTSDMVAYGEIPTYNGTPIKAPTEGKTYAFVGWSPEVVAVTGEATYTAQFEDSTNVYVITWIVDGVSSTTNVPYGTLPKYTGTPSKASTDQYSYVFSGWDKEIVVASQNATYTAQFTQVVNKYTITWIVDGKTTTAQVEYGKTPSYGSTPTKESTAQYTYTFNGWDKEIVAVKGDATYTAQFTSTVNKYTITWIVDGKTTTAQVEYGKTPSYGSTPTKAATAQYTYTFSGWDTNPVAVTGDATYTAKFNETLNKYTITWIVDGKTTTAQVEYGKTPSYGSTPTKATTAQYTYAFSGWDKEIVAVKGDATYTAQFTQTVNKYTITWIVDGKGTTSQVEYGTVPTYSGTPTKTATAQYTYTFSGWDTNPVAVTGDATYTAKFSQTVNKYTITWVVDGKTTTSQVEYGTVPTYSGTPTKTATAQYTYTFSGWDITPVAVTGDATYTAKFSQTVNKYTITWIVDGKTTTSQVAYGTVPTYSGTPTKTATAQYTYTFSGWDKEIVAVKGNATYTAKFTSTVNKYTITWVVDGKSTTSQVAYGTVPTYSGTPTKTATAQYTYTFSGWDKELVAVTGDASYTAKFTSTVNKYTITWIVDGKTTTSQVAYGTVPTYNGTPTKSSTAQYTYTFSGWDKELVAVTGEATYTAKFNQTVNKYTITWVVDGKSTTSQVAYGTVPAYSGTPSKTATAQYTYTFSGWDKTPVAVTGDATYTAKFTSTVNEYTITWIVDGKSTTTKVAYGSVPSYNGTPTKSATAQYTYTFSGWDTTPVAVTGDATYTAKFNQTVNKYTITWIVDGTTTTTSVEYGKTPTFTGSTYKYGYEFIGWTPTISSVTKAATYTAQYSDTSVLQSMPTLQEGETLSTVFSNGNGSKDNPYLIESATALAKLSLLTNGVHFGSADQYFKVTINIDLSKVNWIPICYNNGTTTYYYFQSNFNGNGKTITFNINSESEYCCGLFAGISGTIENLTIKGDMRVSHWSGGLSGYAKDATLKNLTNYVNVTGVNASGQIGGLVGRISNSGSITLENCVNEGIITGGQRVGGLIGNVGNPSTATLTNCINKASVLSTGDYGGGLVGCAQLNSTVTLYDCYNDLSLEESIKANSTYTAEMQYAEGTSARKQVGWIIGGYANPSVRNIYYTVTWVVEGEQTKTNVTYGTAPTYSGTPSKAPTDTIQYNFVGWATTSGGTVVDIEQTKLYESKTYYAVFEKGAREYTITWKVDGKTTTEQVEYGKTPTFTGSTYKYGYEFTGWDKEIVSVTKSATYTAQYSDTSVWDSKYPSVASGYTFSGEGTQASPWLIQSATDLAALSRLTTGKTSYNAGKYYKLTINIDLSCGGWIPICDNNTTAGGWQSAADFFMANFDGSNKTITYQESNVAMCFGLFMGLSNCTVKDLTFNGSITGEHYHAALATYFNKGVIAENIISNVDITVNAGSGVQARIGGIVGQINGKGNQLINCVNNGDIVALSSQTHVGGLVGFAYGETLLTTCLNTGLVKGKITATENYGVSDSYVGYLIGSYNLSHFIASEIAYNKFGVVGNGTTDDFEAIYKAHAYANGNGVKVVAGNGTSGSANYYIKNTVPSDNLKEWANGILNGSHTTHNSSCIYGANVNHLTVNGIATDCHGNVVTESFKKWINTNLSTINSEKAITITIETSVDWTGAKFTIDDSEITSLIVSGTTTTTPTDKQYETDIFTVKPTNYYISRALTASQYDATKALTMTDSEFNSVIAGNAYIKAINEIVQTQGINSSTTKIDLGLGYKAMIVLVNEDLTASATRLIAGKSVQVDPQKVYIRYGSNANSGTTKRDVIILDENGNVDPSTPINFDYTRVIGINIYDLRIPQTTITGGEFTTIASQLDMKFSVNSDGSINENGGTNGAYLRRGLCIKRSNTVLDGVKHYVVNELDLADYDNGLNAAAYGAFYQISQCANVTLNNCVLTARRYSNIAGTYDLQAHTVTGLTFRNCTQSNFWVVENDDGSMTAATRDTANAVPSMSVSSKNKNSVQMYWGVMGTNFCKNIEFYSCTLSRFDAHQGITNGKIVDSTVTQITLIGFGDFLIENSEIVCANSTPSWNTVISLRGDYGSTWKGDVTIRNVTVSLHEKSPDFRIIHYQYNNHDFGYDCYLPNLTVENLTVTREVPCYVFGSSGNGVYDANSMNKPELDGGQTNLNVINMPEYIVIDDYSKYSYEANYVTTSVNTYAGDAFSETNIPVKLTVKHLKLDGSSLGSETVTVGYNETYSIKAKTYSGYEASNQTVSGRYAHDKNTEIIIYYFSISTAWDGTSVSTSLTGSGTEASPYLIKTGADLKYLENQVDGGETFAGKYFKLSNSIDLNNYSITIGYYNAYNDFVAFGGIFNGDNCVIKNLKINNTATTNSTANGSALFGCVTGSVSNITVYGSVTSKAKQASGIVGGLRSTATLINAYSYVTVSGTSGVGGVVAAADGTMTNCVNYGNVTGSSYNVGGVMGLLSTSAKADGCVNFATVTSKSSMGGVAGAVQGTMTNCVNYGEAIASTSAIVAGVAGYGKGTVSNCYNYGKVTGTKVAGIVGYASSNSQLSISDCENFGEIVARPTSQYDAVDVGGIMAYTNNATVNISSCYNYGKITLSNAATKDASANAITHSAGGIIGNTTNAIGVTIDSCINFASVTSNVNRVGGIVGILTVGSVNNCVNYGVITGTSNVAGIVGVVNYVANTTKTISNCTNEGAIKNSSYFGGGICASLNQCTVSNCKNYAVVGSTGDNTGGIVAISYNNGTVVTGCINYGDVKGKTGLGGIMFKNGGTVENCTNNGGFILTTSTGSVASDGIVHTNEGTVTGCVNKA